MRTLPAVAAALSLALLLPACGPAPMPNAPGELAQSDQQRITEAPPAGDVEAVVAGNTDFALDLHRKLAAGTDNVIFSPYSITTALAMTYAGARGDTAKAFETTLHIGLPAAGFHRAMNFLDRELTSRGQGASGKDGKPFRLRPVNQIFTQSGYPLLPAFLDLLAQEYGAGVRLLDFVKDAKGATDDINTWVKEVTEGLIPNLLDPLSPDTRLVLVNAIYFNAAWEEQFDKNATRAVDFEKLDGSKKSVQMMSGQGLPGASATLAGVDVVELPYDGGEVSMVLLAPPSGQLPTFEAQLTSAELTRHLAALQQGSLNVSMPRFDFKTRKGLKDVLTTLGLGVAFTDGADLSGINGTGGLTVFDVVHEAVVKNDENGTEAAAATAVTIGVTSVPQFIELHRPFLFLIRDVKTGAIVFMGRVVDP